MGDDTDALSARIEKCTGTAREFLQSLKNKKQGTHCLNACEDDRGIVDVQLGLNLFEAASAASLAFPPLATWLHSLLSIRDCLLITEKEE